MTTKHLQIPDDINDMKSWAESFGNLHYEKLAEFIYELSDKILKDANFNIVKEKNKLGSKLLDCAEQLFEAYCHIEDALRINKVLIK